jgi:hypothetical protein
MYFKLTYPDGTVKNRKEIPPNFTGKAVDYYGTVYLVNGSLHRDGGLPSWEGSNGYNAYWVNNELTGHFNGMTT